MIQSLRWRLLAGAAAAIFVALALAWLAMTLLFERHLERRLDSELEQFGTRLAAALSIAPDGSLALSETPGDPRFQTPASGLYWQVSLQGDTIAARSLWDQTITAPADAPNETWRSRRAAGPFGETLYIVERNVRPDADDRDVLIQVAQDARTLIAARDDFGRELAAFIAVLWIVLLLAAWAQVRLGLMPLGAVRADLDELQRNPRARLDEARLTEIRPLVSAINALADAREHDLAKAKRRAADLAHGLKTPLSALAAQSRRARELGAGEAATGLDHAIAAIKQAVDAELARSRISALWSAPAASSAAAPCIARVVNVLEHTEKGEHVAVEIDVAEQFRLPLREDDLQELFGSLLENAVRFARRLVRVRATAENGVLIVDIEDDGEGLAADALEGAFERGVRLDQSAPGQGLGLAIAREIVDATGGSAALLRSPLGGLQVRLTWPAQASSQTSQAPAASFTPSRAYSRQTAVRPHMTVSAPPFEREIMAKLSVLPTPDKALPGRAQPVATAKTHFVNGNPLHPPFPPHLEEAVFGLGCFWGAEREFWQAPGVWSTASGYAGGVTPNPTYEEVCTGRTGHTEVVRVIFDPAQTTYADLLKVFFESHDPTQGMRQGGDIGTQYRSAIYTTSPEQKQQAEQARAAYGEKLRAAGFGAITTEIKDAPEFYYAEDYHQQYLAKNPNGYCDIGGTGVSCPIGLGV